MLISSKVSDDFKLENERFRESSRERRMISDKFFYKVIYKTFRDGGNISFEDMDKYSVGEEYDFPSVPSGEGKSIKSRRMSGVEESSLMFRTTFSSRATLMRHTHSNCDEYLSVAKGCSGDFLILTGTEAEGNLDFISLTENDDEVLIPAGLVHQVTNRGKEECSLIVKFKKI